MVDEFLAGAQVPTIAERYAVSEAYVDRVIEETSLSKPQRRRFTSSGRARGNRIVYSLVVGWLTWLAAGRPSEWLILAIALPVYLAITAFYLWLDRQAGTDRQP
jgi:hypothetical protein